MNNNYDFIKREMLTHVPVCTHANPGRVLVIGDTEGLDGELNRHRCVNKVDCMKREVFMAEDFSEEHKRYDIAIVSDGSITDSDSIWTKIKSVLDEKGVVSAVMSNLVTQTDSAKEEMALLGRLFRIVMPYRYERIERSNGMLCSSYLVLASNFYHPTADINLQCADLTDGLRYYNSDIATASFQTPTFLNHKYSGIIKR